MPPKLNSEEGRVEDCLNCFSIPGLYVIILRFVNNMNTEETENYDRGKGKCETGSVRLWYDASVKVLLCDW